MKAQLGGAALLLGLVQAVLAQEDAPSQKMIEFECGAATVVIDSEPKGFRSPEEAFVKTGMHVQAKIVVTRGDSQITFHRQSIDYIGGTCMRDAQDRPRIVYQAFCGGSGCTDQSWGIIDPIELREILIPSKNNNGQARELLGKPPMLAPQRISLLLGN